MGQSSGSSDPPRDDAAMSGGLEPPVPLVYGRNGEDPYRLDGVSAGTRTVSAYSGVQGSYFDQTPYPQQRRDLAVEPQREQQQSFLAPQPADQRDLSADQGISTSDWMAPAAAGVGVAGMAAAAAAAEAHAEKGQGEIVMPPEEEKPEVPEKSTRRSSPPSESAVAVAVADTATTDPKTDVPVVAATPTTVEGESSSGELGGLEREGAHETGTIFPRVIRHDTDMSISHLHIPGKFPKQT